MNVAKARAIGRRWVRDNKKQVPGYCGAIFTGSSIWYPGTRELPLGSDLDICLYQINPIEHPDHRKVMLDGIVLEPSWHDFEEIRDPWRVLGTAYIAPQFSRRMLIDDPYGLIAPVYKTVMAHYREPRWLRERLAAVYRKAKWNYRTVIGAQNATVFGMILRFIGGIHNTAVLLAVAELGNPTLRRCLAVSQIALRKCGALDLQEELLGILGSQSMSAQFVRRHLDSMYPLFDRALALHKSPYWGDRELFPENKARLFGGALEMIEDGHHREAVFYLFFIHHCCQCAILTDGTKRDRARYFSLFEELAQVAGLTDYEACRARAAGGLRVLNRFYARAKQTALRHR